MLRNTEEDNLRILPSQQLTEIDRWTGVTVGISHAEYMRRVAEVDKQGLFANSDTRDFFHSQQFALAERAFQVTLARYPMKEFGIDSPKDGMSPFEILQQIDKEISRVTLTWPEVVLFLIFQDLGLSEGQIAYLAMSRVVNREFNFWPVLFCILQQNGKQQLALCPVAPETKLRSKDFIVLQTEQVSLGRAYDASEPEELQGEVADLDDESLEEA